MICLYIFFILLFIFVLLLNILYNKNIYIQNSRVNYKQKVVIVIIACPKDYKTINLNISKLPFHTEVMICNKISNSYDSREAGLMLDFIIKHYNNLKCDKILFIHDHDVSPHYPESITQRINKLSKEKFIYTSSYIGVNCRYIQFNVGNIYEMNFHLTQEVDKYLTEMGIEHVSMSEVHDNKYIFPCCASFFVDKKLIYLHSLQYYITLRNTLKKFSLYGFKRFVSKDLLKMDYRNLIAGGYMEFTWSTMFGQKNVSYPPDCKINNK